MKPILVSVVAAITILAAGVHAAPGEIETTAADQVRLDVTIYNEDMALVKDQRNLTLPLGESVLAFKGVSGRIIPETALLSSGSLRILEQNFEYDLLTPESLLDKFTGQRVSVIKTNPETGEEQIVPATVLSTAQGVVLEIGNAIETGIPGRIAFPYIPENLRKSPTLTMLVNSGTATRQPLELTYLTRGLTWKADYVAQLDSDDAAVNLSGWVTLTNTSMTSYDNADLQLVAGDVNVTRKPEVRMMKTASPMAAAADDSAFSQESLFEYHLYTLGRKTTLKNNQTKQVALLQAGDVPCMKEFVLKGSSYAFSQPRGTVAEKPKVEVFLEISNTKANNLGVPIPKGTVRVYKEDSRGRLQFAGEDTTDHIPENNVMRLKLGNAFDVTAEKRQVQYRKLAGSSTIGFTVETSHELVLKNSKETDVMVTVLEPIPGDWRIVHENAAHVKASSGYAQWKIPVPAKGEATLEFTVQIR